MRTSYGGTPPGISGTHYGGWALGVRGDAVPATGAHGSALLYQDITLPAEAADEFRTAIVTAPVLGTLFVFEDSSFTFTGPDGVHTGTRRSWKNGAVYTDAGGAEVVPFTITVGAGSSGVLSGTLQLGDITLAGGFASAGQSLLSGTLQLDDVALTGSFAAAGPSQMSGTLTLADLVLGGGFSGSAPLLDADDLVVATWQDPPQNRIWKEGRMDFVLLAGSRPTIDKDPAAVLTYGRDVAGLLALGDTVNSVTGQASGGVVASAPDFVGSVLRVKISGGTPGQMASYKFTWTTAGGDVDSRSIYFNVAAL